MIRVNSNSHLMNVKWTKETQKPLIWLLADRKTLSKQSPKSFQRTDNEGVKPNDPV